MRPTPLQRRTWRGGFVRKELLIARLAKGKFLLYTRIIIEDA